MFGKIKKYFIYRKNMKTAKRELVQIAANTLPLFTKTTSEALSYVNFISHVTHECGKLEGQELVSAIVHELADKLETDETRIFEIIQYIFTLDIKDLKKIVVKAQVETLDTVDM
ncbi:MAG: hypothetical protein HFH68_00220 [Lachnospiraceae bacterium]|nr:hypothetical protein [Lachnospiraceae bacterium]